MDALGMEMFFSLFDDNGPFTASAWSPGPFSSIYVKRGDDERSTCSDGSRIRTVCFLRQHTKSAGGATVRPSMIIL